jgi:hypothetical protein
MDRYDTEVEKVRKREEARAEARAKAEAMLGR